MCGRRFGSLVIFLMLLGLCLAPASVLAKGKPGGGGGPGGGDDPPCDRHIWAETPNLYETDASATQLVVPASGGEVTVARFQARASDFIRGRVYVDGFELTLLQGTPGGIRFKVYVLNSGANCYAREINDPSAFTLYGSATPSTSVFTVDNPGFEFTHDVAPYQFCVFVTAENVSAPSGAVFQLGIDYSYTRGDNRKALNADCLKYRDHGLSNDKSFYDYRNGTEGPPPARTFVSFVVQ